VRASIREIVPFVGAATQTEPASATASEGSGKSRPARRTVRTTVAVAGSTCETVLSTSFVTQSEPDATTTPAGCSPTGTAWETTSPPGPAAAGGATGL
jgi:hypothetical protein